MDQPGIATITTDSRPGKTSPAADDRDSPTTSTNPVESEPNATVVVTENGEMEPSDGAAKSSKTMLGAAVSAAQGFSDFFGQRVGLIASRASMIEGRSIIDVMAEADSVELAAIFAPEHGVRAEAGAGVEIADGVDPVTGLPVFSLYGATRQPTPEMMVGIDVLVFDLQDVGARYYTYTSTMGLAMQSAAEAGIPFVVFDRPNPLGGATTGGTMRDSENVSFISQYPIPSVHGMTAGELALAIKGERWLPGLDDLDLRVIQLQGWSRDDRWDDTGLAWVAPSPGLPSSRSALVYPSTVLFEGTNLSFGRGTDYPFEQIGAPWIDGDSLAEALNQRDLPGVRFQPVTYVPTTTPVNGPPVVDPQFEGQTVSGVRIEVVDPKVIDAAAVGIHLLAEVLAQADRASADQGSSSEPNTIPTPVEVIDRPQFFDLLTGTAEVRRALLAGERPENIISSGTEAVDAFEAIRVKYLLY